MTKNDTSPKSDDVNLADLSDDELVTPPQAAKVIHMSTAFLSRDRWSKNPLIPYCRVGNRAIRYRMFDLRAHIRNQMVRASE